MCERSHSRSCRRADRAKPGPPTLEVPLAVPCLLVLRFIQADCRCTSIHTMAIAPLTCKGGGMFQGELPRTVRKTATAADSRRPALVRSDCEYAASLLLTCVLVLLLLLVRLPLLTEPHTDGCARDAKTLRRAWQCGALSSPALALGLSCVWSCVPFVIHVRHSPRPRPASARQLAQAMRMWVMGVCLSLFKSFGHASAKQAILVLFAHSSRSQIAVVFSIADEPLTPAQLTRARSEPNSLNTSGRRRVLPTPPTRRAGSGPMSPASPTSPASQSSADKLSHSMSRVSVRSTTTPTSASSRKSASSSVAAASASAAVASAPATGSDSEESF
jgi:hypothetical protein